MSRPPSPDLDETSVSTHTSYDTTLSSRADDETYIDSTFYANRSLRLGKERHSLLLKRQQQALLPKSQVLFGFGVNRFLQQSAGGSFGASRNGSLPGKPLASSISAFESTSSLSSLISPAASPSPIRRLSLSTSIDGELLQEARSSSVRSLPFSEFSVTSYVDNDSSSYATAAPTHQVLALKQKVRDLEMQLETQKLESSTRTMQYEAQLKSLQSTCREQLRMIEVLRGEESFQDLHRDDGAIREHSSHGHHHLLMPLLAGNSFSDDSIEDDKKEDDDNDDDAESPVVEESRYLAEKQSAMIHEMQTELDANDSAMDALLEEIDALQRRQKDFLSRHSKRSSDAKDVSSVSAPTTPMRQPQSPEQPTTDDTTSLLQLQDRIATLQEERDEYKNRLKREEAKTELAMKALAVAHDRLSSFERIVATAAS